MYKILSFSLFFIIVLSSCKQKIIVDNALNEKITVEIANKKYNIDSNKFLELKVKKGSQKIISYNSNNDTLLNSVVDIENDGILNATNTSYILWTDIYCDEADYNKYKDKLNIKDTVKLDNLEFIDVDFKIIKDAFIEKNWSYGLNEKMPDTLDLKNDEKYRIVSKIYRPNEIKKEFNYIGDIDFNDLNENEINKILESR